LGLYVSFSGILTFKRSDELRAIAAELPAESACWSKPTRRILLRMPWRGKRNEPAFVADTNKVLADARGVSEDDMARQTSENFFRLFSKVPGADAQ
jgi:TatD DNase family protein